MRIGVSGLRGIVGTDLGPADISAICESFGAMCGASVCALGADTRESGPMLKHAAAASLVQGGLDILDFGIAPTPVIFRESRQTGAGVVITASHNPTEWNGLKFVVRGRGIDASTLSAITPKNTRHGSVGSHTVAHSKYVDDAVELVGTINDNVSVALDAGGGAALDTARKLLEKMNCTVRIIESMRGPDPTSDKLTELAEASRECDIGLGFDLDGDRVVVAKNGQIQTPDSTLAIGVAWALEHGSRKFALSQDTSVAVKNMIIQSQGSIVQSSVGELNVVNAIDEHGCDAGGEGSSAGFIFPEFNYCRDGILTGAISAAMSSSGKLDDALAAMSGHYQIRQKVTVPAALHRRIIEAVSDELSSEFTKVDALDGFYGVIDASTWVLVRGSNTEDSVRISAESSSNERAQGLARRVYDTVEKNIAAVR